MGGVTRDVRSGAMWSGREREALYSKSKLARWCSIAMQRAVRTPGVAGLGLVRFQGGATPFCVTETVIACPTALITKPHKAL